MFKIIVLFGCWYNAHISWTTYAGTAKKGEENNTTNKRKKNVFLFSPFFVLLFRDFVLLLFFFLLSFDVITIFAAGSTFIFLNLWIYNSLFSTVHFFLSILTFFLCSLSIPKFLCVLRFTFFYACQYVCYVLYAICYVNDAAYYVHLVYMICCSAYPNPSISTNPRRNLTMAFTFSHYTRVNCECNRNLFCTALLYFHFAFFFSLSLSPSPPHSFPVSFNGSPHK